MAIVSVAGAHNETINLQLYANAAAAQQLADQITSGVRDGTIQPAEDNHHPRLPAGTTGEFVQTKNGSFVLPKGYDAVVDAAKNSSITGSGGENESVLAGSGNFAFHAHEGSGTVFAGNGNDSIRLDRADAGSWNVNLGDGANTIRALGSGNDTLTAGHGRDLFFLGSGNDLVSVTGAATVDGGSGNTTLFGGSKLDFTAGSGNTTIDAGTACHDDTFTFVKGQAGGQTVIQDFGAGDQIDLKGYSAQDIFQAVANAQHTAQGTTITLSDKTQITFSDVRSMDPSMFRSS